MEPSRSWGDLGPELGAVIPLIYALLAWAAPRLGAPWMWTRRGSTVAMGTAWVGAFFLFGPEVSVPSRAMLVLATSLAWVILRFSEVYLHGEKRHVPFLQHLLVTLASITTLFVTDHLLVLLLAWVATSLALHPLLTFYGDRVPARIAAHKKFLLSRLADACALGGVFWLGSLSGEVHVDAINRWASQQEEFPLRAQVGPVLIALAVILKSAQVPFHGWLTQVMEAPTPVSALLHAGIVNIGGFLLIRLAPLFAHSGTAQALLVLSGLTTALVASLIMMTRVSVKVALAWSTCAQLGFMLLECGLGFWHVALLHILGHSLYKAHAFLSSGSAVERWRDRFLAPKVPPPSKVTSTATTAATGLVSVAFAKVMHPLATALLPILPLAPREEGSSLGASVAPSLVLGLAVAPLVARSLALPWLPRLALLGQSVAMICLGFALHGLAGHLCPSPSLEGSARWVAEAGWMGTATCFVLLAYLTSPTRTGASKLQVLHPRLFAGLYLDDIFTRLTFQLWPPALPPPSEQAGTLSAAAPAEVTP